MADAEKIKELEAKVAKERLEAEEAAAIAKKERLEAEAAAAEAKRLEELQKAQEEELRIK